MTDVMKELHGLLFMLIGILMGMLLMISIKYPLELSEIDKIKKSTCLENSVSKIRVGINGRIYEVICANGIDYKLKPLLDETKTPTP